MRRPIILAKTHKTLGRLDYAVQVLRWCSGGAFGALAEHSVLQQCSAGTPLAIETQWQAQFRWSTTGALNAE